MLSGLLRARAVAVGLALAQVVGALPIEGQSSLWYTYMSGGRRALTEGRTEEARDLFLAAREEAVQAGMAETLYQLGRAERVLGLNAEALSNLEQSYRIYRREKGDSSVELAGVLVEIGGIYRAQGRLEDGALQLREALTIQEATLGQTDPAVVATLRVLAGIYSDLGKHTQAEALYRRVLASGALEQEGRALADDLLPLAQIYLAQEKHDKALPLLRRSLRALDEPGLEQQRAGVASQIGAMHRARGEFDEAEKYLVEAVEIYRSVGEKTAESVEAAYILGEFFRQADRYDDAQIYFEEALSDATLIYGKSGRELVPILVDYSSLLWRLGQKGAATKLQSRAKWIRVRKGKAKN